MVERVDPLLSKVEAFGNGFAFGDHLRVSVVVALYLRGQLWQVRLGPISLRHELGQAKRHGRLVLRIVGATLTKPIERNRAFDRVSEVRHQEAVIAHALCELPVVHVSVHHLWRS